MINRKATLMKRRTIAIIASVIAVALLAVALIIVLDYVNATSVEDPADGTVYFVRKKDGVYRLYDTDKKTVMPSEEETGYYVTRMGSLIEVDEETGEYEIVAIVDTEGNEQVGFNQRLLMFPHIEKAKILQLDVYNDTGSFTFVRYNAETGKVDSSGSFVIKGSPQVSFDEELFASLYVSAGYTLTTRKIENPIKDENGEFSEYGLIPERRVREVTDENGEFVLNADGSYQYEEYDYTPAYYILTDISGNKYKVIIGDLMVTGGGYYVQYVDMSGEAEVKRDAVYVLSSDISESLLAPIEDFVTPQLTYPMSLNNYFDVEKFYIFAKNGNTISDKPIVGFSYIDLTERENTINASVPYVFLDDIGLNGYTASSDNIDKCLQGLYSPSFVGVTKLSPTIEDFVKCGLAAEDGVDENGEKKYQMLAERIITFNFDITDDDGKYVETIRQFIYVSALTENNTRYAFTEVYEVKSNGKVSSDPIYDYDMIVEVNAHSFEFLNWDGYAWINSGYVNLNIAFCDKITLTAPGYSASFELDNTESDSTESTSSTNLKVHATDSNGNDKITFSKLNVIDNSGNIWNITGTDITCYSSSGTSLTIKTAYYAYNTLGTQVKVISGYIQGADGSKVYVSADEVRVVTASGTSTYLRYDTSLFRNFYKTLLYASISDAYSVTPEEETAIVTDENLLLTMEITDSTGATKVYKFYKLTSRKAYITINGNGGFYVLNNRVEKFISDAQRFFANEMIDATAKN